jgi:hypothetical protein
MLHTQAMYYRPRTPRWFAHIAKAFTRQFSLCKIAVQAKWVTFTSLLKSFHTYVQGKLGRNRKNRYQRLQVRPRTAGRANRSRLSYIKRSRKIGNCMKNHSTKSRHNPQSKWYSTRYTKYIRTSSGQKNLLQLIFGLYVPVPWYKVRCKF